jgi:hypothetical protein
MPQLIIGSITFEPTARNEVADFFRTTGDDMTEEAKEHFEEIAINNAQRKGYSRWLCADDGKTQHFVTAVKTPEGIVLEYSQV